MFLNVSNNLSLEKEKGTQIVLLAKNDLLDKERLQI